MGKKVTMGMSDVSTMASDSGQTDANWSLRKDI